MKHSPLFIALTLAVSGLFIASCDKQDNDAEASAEQQMPPAVVNVMPVKFETVPLIKEFSGRTSAYEVADIRPQVTGVVQEILFRQGGMVNKGQPLYRISPENYQSNAYANQAAVQQALANVETSKANYQNAIANIKSREAEYNQAISDLNRIQPLLELNAISEQQVQQAQTRVETAKAALESSKAAAMQAQANIGSAQAAVETAKAQLQSSKLDMSRTTVRAPISGISERSNVTAGALVNANQSQPMVTISRINPIYVDIRQSSTEMLELRQQIAKGELKQATSKVELVLEDGSVYPIYGQLAVQEAKVDEDTGSVTLRAIFNNDNHVLLPGMYVQARLIQGVINNAVLVPQSALMRTPKGDTQVYIVDKDNKIQVRPVTVNGTIDGNWIVTDGLHLGDNIVAIGGSKVNPDQEVVTKPYKPTPDEAPSGSKPIARMNSNSSAASRTTQPNSRDANSSSASTTNSTNGSEANNVGAADNKTDTSAPNSAAQSSSSEGVN